MSLKIQLDFEAGSEVPQIGTTDVECLAMASGQILILVLAETTVSQQLLCYLINLSKIT